MGHAKYIGRVGGLAVALGVGVAVATTPGVAWAVPSDSDSSNPTSDASSTSSSAGSSSESGGSSSASSGGDDAASTVDGSESAAGDDESTGSDASEGNKKSTTASVKDKKSGSDASAAAVTPKVPKRAVARFPSNSDISNGEQAAASTAVVQRNSHPVTAPAVNNVSVVDVVPQTTLTTSTTQSTVDTPRVEASPKSEVTPLASTLLSAVGLAPSADGDTPELPGDSPLLLAGLAALRRQTQQASTGDEALARTVDDPSQSSLMLSATEPTVNPPDHVTGEVTGAVNVIDLDGNPATMATYAVTTDPSEGSATVNPDGGFSYTPTQAARLAAATTQGADTDQFTVTVTDGQLTQDVPVTVLISAAQLQSSTSVPSGTTLLGSSPTAVAFSADGKRMYVANSGSGTVSVIGNDPTDAATYQKVIDVNTATTTVDSIKVGSTPSALVLSADGKRLYVANRGSATVSVIGLDPADTATYHKVIDMNPATSTVDSIKVGAYPTAMALSPDGKRLYVANRSSNSVSVIGTDPADTATYHKTIDMNPATSTVDSIKVGSSPRALSFSPDGTRLYVANYTSGTVSVIGTDPADTATYHKTIDMNPATSTVDSIKVGASPTSLAASDDGKLYVARYGTGLVAVVGIDPAGTATYHKLIDVNPATSTVDSIKVGAYPTSVRLSSDGSLAYVANGKDTLSVIDTKTNTVVGTLAIDSVAETGEHHITLGPDGQTLYVSDARDRKVRVVSLAHVNGAPQLVGQPTIDAVDPDSGKVTGSFTVADPDGDVIGYSTMNGLKGTVVVLPGASPGEYNFTYTPTQEAREDAAQTPGADTDSFSVSLNDGSTTTNVGIAVPVEPRPADMPVWNEPTRNFNPETGVTVGHLNVTDPDGDALSYQVAGTGPFYGNIALDEETGDFTYTATLDETQGQLSQEGIVIAISDDTYTIYRELFVDTYRDDVALQALAGDEASALMVDDPSQLSLTSESVVELNAVPAYELSSSVSVGKTPTGVAVSPDGGLVYVADRYTKTVYVIDTGTNTIAASIPIGAGPNDVVVSPDGSRAYVGMHGVNRVGVIDTATNTLIGTVKVGAGVTEVALTPDGSRVYTANTSGNTVSVVDTATLTEIARVKVGSTPTGVAVTPDGSRVYVTSRYSNNVSVIDTATNTVVGTVKVGSSPRAVAIAPDGSRAYVTSAGPNTVSVIDTATNTVVATVVVGSDPIGVATSPDGTLVFAANSNDTVSVIDTATNTVVDTFSVDSTPATGIHYIAVGPDGTVYVTDYKDKMLRVATSA